MRKMILSGLVMIYIAVTAAFAQEATFRVQGHERPDLKPAVTAASKSLTVRETAAETAFTFDDIQFWVGTGSKRAALVVDWHDDKMDHALAWGYRWDGEATGYDMVAAVAKADPRFTFLTHETNLGNTIAGLGFNRHLPYETEIVYAKDGDTVKHSPKDGIVMTDAYNYDDWSCSDAAGLWKSGWYTNGYWSYQVKDAADDEFSYSNWGASSRTLTDGCMDGWSFAALDGTTEGSLPRMPYEAVTPAAEPTEATAYWGQMYKNPEHQSIVDLPLAITQNQLSVKWEYNFGGYSGQPIVVGDYMYNTTGRKICKISVADGSLVAEQAMAGSIGFFSMIAYGDGKIFVTLGGGLMQAFDAITLKPLWQSKVEVGGQQLCPIVYHDGYVYTGTWNGGNPATGVYYCISTEDADPEVEDEIKTPVWQSSNTGFYWSGGSIVGDCIFVGGDDGVMRSYNRLTGEVVDEWEVAPDIAGSTIRSGTSYDEKTGRLFFTGKEARKIYSVKITSDGRFEDASKLSTDIAGQATTTPTVYNGRVYATSGTMTSGGGLDVFNAETLEKIYSVDMGGISQSTPVVSTAFATEANRHEVYVYVCLNNATGDIVCIKDFEGNPEPIVQYRWQAPKTQYCTHSVVVDQYGTIYYKNDSRGFWALSSQGVSLDPSAVKIKIGDRLALMPRVVLMDANKNVNWKSTDETVATVNGEGVVAAVAVGEAKIVVTMEEGGFTDTCKVSVFTPLTEMALSTDKVEMKVGDDKVLEVTVQPVGSTEDLVWTSSNPAVATVNADGRITAVSVGEANITVATKDGRLTETCLVKTVPVAVTGVNIVATATTVGKNGLQLTAEVLPENATDKRVTWISSDPAKATVSETGRVTAVTPGQVTITVSTEDGGFTATQAVTVDIVPVTGVTISQTTLALAYNGSNVRLSATVEPSNATINAVTYESIDETVATVNDYGWVWPEGIGTTKVIVRTVNGNFTDTCVVTVEEIHVAGISLGSDTIRIEDGKTKRLTVTFTPTAVSNKTVVWSSTNEAVATVNATGTVTPTGNGEAKIIVTAEDGGFADTCVVLVSNLAVKAPIAATGVSLSNRNLTLILGKSGRMLVASVLPDTATNQNVTWKSTDETVATVSEKGTVTAVAAGKAFIIVKTQDGGFTDTCKVTVRVAVMGVTLDKTEAELAIGGTPLQLTATVMPENATDKNVTWQSSDETVVTVSETGLVTAVAVGEADITVTTADGGFMATCRVKVTADDPTDPDDPAVAVTGVTLDKTEAELEVGGTLLQLTATVMPENATNRNVTWQSSDETVAKVSASGLVTAVAAGETVITVTTADGNFTATCRVKVMDSEDPAVAVTGVTLDRTEAGMKVGDAPLQLTATVMPENATNRNVTWQSSDETVATVGASGLVTAVSVGEAVITVTTADGNFSATCRVKVTAGPTANEAGWASVLVSVYPNPTSDAVQVEMAEAALLEVFGLDGRVVFRQAVGAGVQTVTLDKSGIYVVRVTAGDRVAVKRVVRR